MVGEAGDLNASGIHLKPRASAGRGLSFGPGDEIMIRSREPRK
jgi:hypothetical protein